MALSDTLKLIITADGSQASSQFKKVGADAEKSMAGAEGGSSKLSAAMGMLGPAALAGGAAIVAFGKASVDTYQNVGTEVLKLQRYTGQSAEDTSRLRFALQQSGIDVDTAAKSFGIFSKKLEASPASFSAYNIATKDSSGKTLGLHDVLLNTADQFEKMPNGPEKTAAALKLFGRAGADMVPFLNRGRDGIADLEKQTDSYGLTLSGKNLDDIKRSKAAQRELSAAIQGLQVQIGEKLVPALTNATDKLVGLTKAATSMPSVFSKANDAVGGLSGKFLKAGLESGPFTGAIVDAGEALGFFGGSSKKASIDVGSISTATNTSSDAVQGFIDKQKQAGITYTSTADASQAYKQSIQDAADATDTAVDSTQTFTAQLKLANDNVSQAKGELDAATQKLKGWFDTIQGNVDQEANYQQSVDDLTEAVKKNGHETDLSSQAARDNLKAIEDVRNSIIDKAIQTAKDTHSVQQGTDQAALYTAGLQQQLIKLGFTKDQAKAYIDQLGLTPKDVETAFKQAGLQEGMDHVQTYSDALTHLNGLVVVSQIIAQYKSEGVRPGALGADINSNAGKAFGGPVHRGESYIVGDRRGLDTAEVFTPGSDGYITPGAASFGGNTGGQMVQVFVGGEQVEAVVTSAQRYDARGRR